MALKIILSVIPLIWIIGALPWVNRVEPLILGLPFLAAWMVSGCFVAFGCLYTLFHIHGRHQKEGE